MKTDVRLSGSVTIKRPSRKKCLPNHNYSSAHHQHYQPRHRDQQHGLNRQTRPMAVIKHRLTTPKKRNRFHAALKKPTSSARGGRSDKTTPHNFSKSPSVSARASSRLDLSNCLTHPAWLLTRSSHKIDTGQGQPVRFDHVTTTLSIYRQSLRIQTNAGHLIEHTK